MNKRNYGTFLINILLSKRLDATKASLRITFAIVQVLMLQEQSSRDVL